MREDVGLYFKKISEKLDKNVNELRGKRQVTCSQGKVLWYLHRHDKETVTMRDIEKFLDCSHATVSGLVSRLQQKGFVALEQNETDKRAKNVCLTEKAWSNFRIMTEHRQQTEAMLMQGFSEAERAQLLEYMKRIYNNL